MSAPQLWHRTLFQEKSDQKVFFVEADVRVKMRDGIDLVGDLYLPDVIKPESLPLSAKRMAHTQRKHDNSPRRHGSTRPTVDTNQPNFKPVEVDEPEVPLASTMSFKEKVPCVLIRTPYNKSKVHESMRHPALFWVQNNYACMIVDCRGRFKSQGQFYKYVNEAEDGFDTVQWLAEQPWCSGQICCFGVSYLAHVQTSMACLAPPNLTAMFVVKGGFFDAITSGIRQGGVFEARQWLWAMKNEGGDSHHTKTRFSLAEVKQRAKGWALRHPYQPGDSPLSASRDYERYVFEYATRVDLSSFWRRPGLSIVQDLDRFSKAPMFLLTGWYDIYARSSVEIFNAMQPRLAPGHCKLVVGPWVHTGTEGNVSGEVDFGMRAVLDNNVAESRYDLALRWFDEHTRSEDDVMLSPEIEASSSVVATLPPVLYFRMGGGEGFKTPHGHMYHGGVWLAANQFPPANTQEAIYVFESSGRLRAPSTTRVATVRAAAKKRPGPISPEKVVEWARKHAAQHVPATQRAPGGAAPTMTPQTVKRKQPALVDENKVDIDKLEQSVDDTPTKAAPAPQNDRIARTIATLSNGLHVPSNLCSRFVYDPRKPFPSLGGHITPFDGLCFPGAYNQTERAAHVLCDTAALGLPLSARSDVLAFRTRPLSQALDITGSVKMVLFVSSSCVDTDFYAMLVDEYPPSEDYPEGFSMNISHGICRCSSRNIDFKSPTVDDSQFEPSLLEPEQVYCIEIEMYPTSNLFSAGHHLAVYVSSSSYPMFDINPNTGSPAAGGGSKLTRVAENTVWHTHALPSHIVLPVVTKSPPVPPQFVPVAEVLPTFQDDSKSDDDSDDDDYCDDTETAENDN